MMYGEKDFPEEYFPDKEFPESDPDMKDLEPIKVGPFKEDEIMLDRGDKKENRQKV